VANLKVKEALMNSHENYEYYEPEIETKPRRQLEKLQLERLKWQVERCYQGSEFYRERFSQIGLRPDDIKSIHDIERIPPVTKQELREEQAAYPPFGRYIMASSKDWRETHPSTGTTGVPVNTIWTHRDREIITRWTARTLWNFGVRPGDTIQNSFSYGLWVAGMAVHYAGQSLGCFVIPIGATMTERQIEYMQHVGSTVLISTPSYAIYLAEKLKQKGISTDELCLRLGCFGGEAGTEIPCNRNRIELGLGIDAFDYYGLAEIGPTCASECSEKAGIHFIEDHILVEAINKDTGEICDPGELGVLVLTHLTKEATPLLRYWTNDYVRLDYDQCTCGRTHTRAIGGILGRADDLIIYKGENFYPAQVEKVVRSFEELSSVYRIRITTDERTGIDSVTVVAEHVNETANIDELKKILKKALRDELAVTPEVELVKFGTLERSEFKARRVEDLRRTV
jgi:phenylacetate-CoA ligase